MHSPASAICTNKDCFIKVVFSTVDCMQITATQEQTLLRSNLLFRTLREEETVQMFKPKKLSEEESLTDFELTFFYPSIWAVRCLILMNNLVPQVP